MHLVGSRKKIYKPDSEFVVVSKAIYATDYFFFSGVYYTRYKAPSVFPPQECFIKTSMPCDSFRHQNNQKISAQTKAFARLGI